MKSFITALFVEPNIIFGKNPNNNVKKTKINIIINSMLLRSLIFKSVKLSAVVKIIFLT